ncbi:hypothetical protein BDA99DRAFT_608354 [Phascolomyces articulosus]|uniref:Uncharacterized protein n=1 Tax=Phascolomyces articulosus TaxID=60185 RepID=A0AAD5JRK6_9FUNG|nr:hypothetical protein BDA99DRAFT_608354 [Phascolomyces articulosus]
MESPLNCRQQEELDDEHHKYAFEDRSMMVRTPPPSYHDVISTSRKHDDPWLARMNSLDETVVEMRRAVQDTHYMMKNIQNKFETTKSQILFQQQQQQQRKQPTSLSEKRLRSSKSFSSSSFSSDENDTIINNYKKNLLTTNIDQHHHHDADADDEQEEDDDEEDDSSATDGLDRIAESLQQLIEQAQSSLKSRLAIRDRSYGSMMHRSNSCPQMSNIYSTQEERRQSDTDTPSTPQLFDWNDQRERFFDSQSRLTQAMHDLTLVCCQDNLNTAITNSPTSFLLQTSPSTSSAFSSSLQQQQQLQFQQSQENIIVQHHYHEHHHYHYHSPSQQQEQQNQQQQQHQMSQLLNYAWSSIRAISSNSSAAAAEAAARSARILENLNKLNEKLNSNHYNKPLLIHPPRIALSKTNIVRLMVYITLLIFSFMNQQQQNQSQHLSKKCITARRCIGQFVSHASDSLPISTWIQHSTLLVYIMAFL